MLGERADGGGGGGGGKQRERAERRGRYLTSKRASRSRRLRPHHLAPVTDDSPETFFFPLNTVLSVLLTVQLRLIVKSAPQT